MSTFDSHPGCFIIIHSVEKENPHFLILVTTPEYVGVNALSQHCSLSQNVIQ